MLERINRFRSKSIWKTPVTSRNQPSGILLKFKNRVCAIKFWVGCTVLISLWWIELVLMNRLRIQRMCYCAVFSACQSQLPASGAAPIKQPMEQLNQHYKEYFYKRTLENWKFFIVSFVS